MLRRGSPSRSAVAESIAANLGGDAHSFIDLQEKFEWERCRAMSMPVCYRCLELTGNDPSYTLLAWCTGNFLTLPHRLFELGNARAVHMAPFIPGPAVGFKRLQLSICSD